MRNSRKRDVNISTTVFAQLNEIKIEAKRHEKYKNSEKWEKIVEPRYEIMLM